MKKHTDIDNYLQFLRYKKQAEKGNLQAKKLYDKLVKKYSKQKYVELYQEYYLKKLLHQAYELKKPRAMIKLKKLEKIAVCKRQFMEIKTTWGEAHAIEIIKKIFGKKMLIAIFSDCPIISAN